MKRLKKALRLFVLVVLLMLASLGVSIAGGIPVPSSNKRKDIAETAIELAESSEDKTELPQPD